MFASIGRYWLPGRGLNVNAFATFIEVGESCEKFAAEGALYYGQHGQDNMIEVNVGADGNINRIGERHESDSPFSPEETFHERDLYRWHGLQPG